MMRGLNNENNVGTTQANSQLTMPQHANSHQPALRRLDGNAIGPNSYLNNSSVAKTAMHKRRNIPLGALGGVHPNMDNITEL